MTIKLVYLNNNDYASLGPAILSSYLHQKDCKHAFISMKRPEYQVIDILSFGKSKNTKRKGVNFRRNDSIFSKAYYIFKKKFATQLSYFYLNYNFYMFNNVLNVNIRKIAIQKNDLIGFSVLSYEQLISSLVLAKKIKKMYNVKIVFGGAYIKLYHKLIDLQTYKFVDYWVYTNGEKALYKLNEYLDNKIKIKDVPSLIYLKKGRRVYNQQDEISFESQPLPEYPSHILDKLNVKDSIQGNYGLYYSLTRGCKNNCTYCSYKNLEGIGFKHPQKVIQDLKLLVKKTSINKFRFVDSNINQSKKYLENVCDEIINNKLKIKWLSHAYPIIDRKLLVKMKKSGCFFLRFGIESASENILKNMNRLEKLKDIETTLKNTYEVGISVYCSFILGYPYETKNDINKIINFVKRNEKYISKLSFHEFGLYYDTDIYNNPDKYKISIVGRFSKEMPELFKFNEKYGLKWKSKKKQVSRHIKTLKKALSECDIDISFDTGI